MKKWLSDQSIIVKLMVTGGSTILIIMLLSALITAYFFYRSYTANKIHTIANSIERDVFLARIAEKDFVKDDLIDTDFYRTGRSDHLEENRAHISNVRVKLMDLIHLWSGPREQRAKELLELSDQYQHLFSEIVKTYREIGFKDWGLLGEWRQAIHTVEQAVPQANHPAFHENILQLRRLEKDYILRGDETYLQEIKTQLLLLRTLISGIDNIDRTAILQEVDRYEEAFEQYLMLKKKIGRTQKEGLQKDFAAIITKIKSAIGHIYSEAKNENQKARQALITASVIIYLLGFILGGAGFYYFARSISTRLTGLKDAVLKVGQGQLDTQMADDNTDEIGVLTKAFNKMTTDLKAITISKDELRVLSSKNLEAHEDERKIVARELHDGIGQALTGIKFCIENGIRKLEDGSPISQVKEINKTIPLIREAVEEVRRISMGLRPSTLDDIGIAETLFWYCHQFEEIYKFVRIRASVEVEEGHISDALKTAIFRIVQESMNNVAKHSRADRVLLNLHDEGDRLELTIEDNGVGFEDDSQEAGDTDVKGFGLAGMRERAELSGGTLSIHSRLNGGTRLTATWPMAG
jgi:signal transduction histidine kinase